MLFDAKGHPTSCEFQRAAAESLGQIGSPRAIPHLIEALRWQHVRWFAERALVKIGRPSVEPLIAALQNEDPAVREAVVVALGEIGDATAVPTLIRLLTVPEEEIRAAATRSLGLLKAPQAVGPLLEAKEKGLATFEYFEALGRIGGEAALHEILAAIESARYASQTWQALAAIGESAIPFVQGALVACPEDKRINYICALGEMSCPEATEALRRIQRGEADGHTLGQTVD
jgi:HEAT repeat protein